MMDACLLESEGDTEDDEETDGTVTHNVASHVVTSSITDTHTFDDSYRIAEINTIVLILDDACLNKS